MNIILFVVTIIICRIITIIISMINLNDKKQPLTKLWMIVNSHITLFIIYIITGASIEISTPFLHELVHAINFVYGSLVHYFSFYISLIDMYFLFTKSNKFVLLFSFK